MCARRWQPGALTRRADGFKLVATEASGSLFTVHGDAHEVIAVGGARTGVFVIGDGDKLTAIDSDYPLIQGVCVLQGLELASGQLGAIYQREPSGAWRELKSLHALWIDPKGGVWAVGGKAKAEARPRSRPARAGRGSGCTSLTRLGYSASLRCTLP